MGISRGHGAERHGIEDYKMPHQATAVGGMLRKALAHLLLLPSFLPSQQFLQSTNVAGKVTLVLEKEGRSRRFYKYLLATHSLSPFGPHLSSQEQP